MVVSVMLMMVFVAFPAAAGEADELLAATRDAMGRGETESALVLASKAVAAEPDNPSIYIARAAIYEHGEFEKAIADYTKVVELARGAGVYQRRGEDFFRVGRFAESVADFDRVIAASPDQAPYHWQRGISLYYAR